MIQKKKKQHKLGILILTVIYLNTASSISCSQITFWIIFLKEKSNLTRDL